MKLGLGLYRSMLTSDNFRFAKQAGATHLVVHLTDYFNAADSLSTGSGDEPWGVTQNQDKLWTAEELIDLRKSINDAGLELAASESFDPSHWYECCWTGRGRHGRKVESLKRAPTSRPPDQNPFPAFITIGLNMYPKSFVS